MGKFEVGPKEKDGLVNEYIAMIYFCQNLFERGKKEEYTYM